jgi:anti-sigma factor RsiW
VNEGRTSAHVTDEELMLEFYGEASPEHRAVMQAHLDVCEECRALNRELRGVLALVDNEPVPDPPPEFEREMWARLEPQIRSRANLVSGLSRTFGSFWTFELPRWALAAGAAALAIGSFALGRVWPAPGSAEVASGVSATRPADTRAVNERLLLSEVEEHLERSQRVLVELANADDSAPVVLASGRTEAADLVAAGRLYRRTMGDMGDADTRDLLEDIERVLVEVANGPDERTSNDLTAVRTRISNQDLIFRLRVMTAEMRSREQRARGLRRES